METKEKVTTLIEVKCCAECLFRTFLHSNSHCGLCKRTIFPYSSLQTRPPFCPLHDRTLKIEGI